MLTIAMELLTINLCNKEGLIIICVVYMGGRFNVLSTSFLHTTSQSPSNKIVLPRGGPKQKEGGASPLPGSRSPHLHG